MDYFEVLGVRRGFGLDPSELEKQFYALSRALHPDRFSTASAEARTLSMERMSLVNQAYTTLKAPEKRRAYLLSLVIVPGQHSQDQHSKGTMPVELAEDWFELQDLMAEGSERSRPEVLQKVKEFGLRVQEMLDRMESEIRELEKKYDMSFSGDADAASSALEEIARRARTKSYLTSLLRDVRK